MNPLLPDYTLELYESSMIGLYSTRFVSLLTVPRPLFAEPNTLVLPSIPTNRTSPSTRKKSSPEQKKLLLICPYLTKVSCIIE